MDPVEIDNLQPGRPLPLPTGRQRTARDHLWARTGRSSPPRLRRSPGVTPSDVAETSATLSALINPGRLPDHLPLRIRAHPRLRAVRARRAARASRRRRSGAGQPAPDRSPTRRQYHFRVVATNNWGSEATDDSTFNFFPPDCPNAYARQLTRAAYLPDCRAYELVSPGNAGGDPALPRRRDPRLSSSTTSADFYPPPARPSPNPGTAISPARFTFLGFSGALPAPTRPTRWSTPTPRPAPNGWVTRYWGLKGNEAIVAAGPSATSRWTSASTTRCRDLFGIDPTISGSRAPYVWDCGRQQPRPLADELQRRQRTAKKYVGDDRPSPDFRHYVFSSMNIAFAADGVTKRRARPTTTRSTTRRSRRCPSCPKGEDIRPGIGGAAKPKNPYRSRRSPRTAATS